MNKLTGLIPAVYTPMHDNGDLNLAAVPPMTERLIKAGVSGVYVCGSTGEGHSLTVAERREVVEAFIAAAAGRVPVIVQVGHNCVREARALAAHAREAGADMISSVSPSYFKPASLDALVLTMAGIAEGAPELPFYYYHIPSMTGLQFDMVDFLERSGERIPNLAGVKYTDLKIFEFQASALFMNGRYDILWGCDEMMLGALAVGARGAVGSTFNLVPRLYLAIMEAFEAQNLEEARRLQMMSVTLVRILNRYAPLHTCQKALMRMVGPDCGGVRLPQLPLADGIYEKVEADILAAGLDRWMA
jgi:N-acetylneuraminate lyase